MRIVNRHFSDLMAGYERIVSYNQQFESLVAKDCARWKEQNSRAEEAYQFQVQQRKQEIQRIDEVYNRTVDAWNRSEKPTRDVYDRHRVQWRKRYNRVIHRAEADLSGAREDLRKDQKLLTIAILACLLIITIPFALPAALILWIITREEKTQVARLQARVTSLRAVKEPLYKPLSKPPTRAAYPDMPRKPNLIPMPSPSNMLEKWWKSLENPPSWLDNEERQHEGLKGEALLLDALAQALDDSFIAVSGAKLEHSLDGDVIVVGANGIWVLDSKYVNGKITYDGQAWSHEKLIAYQGGRGATEWVDKEIGDPGSEWLREYESVNETLRRHMRRPHPHVIGGIAFTHEKADLNIHDSFLIGWGTTAFWVDRIQSVRQDLSFPLGVLIECVQHILTYSQILEKDKTHSAAHMAETVYSEVSSAYQRFKATHKIDR